jgi:hypothetical protein
MAAKTKWWQAKVAMCEDEIARTLTARDGLRDTLAMLQGMQRRGLGDRDNLDVAVQVLSYSLGVVDAYRAQLHGQRAALND